MEEEAVRVKADLASDLAGEAGVGLAGSGAPMDCAGGEPGSGVGLDEHGGPDGREAGQHESASGQSVCDGALDKNDSSSVDRVREEWRMAPLPFLSRPPPSLLVSRSLEDSSATPCAPSAAVRCPGGRGVAVMRRGNCDCRREGVPSSAVC